MELDELIRILDIEVGFQLQTKLSELWDGVLEKYSYLNAPNSNVEFPDFLLGRTGISRMKNGSIEAMEASPQIVILS